MKTLTTECPAYLGIVSVMHTWNGSSIVHPGETRLVQKWDTSCIEMFATTQNDSSILNNLRNVLIKIHNSDFVLFADCRFIKGVDARVPVFRFKYVGEKSTRYSCTQQCFSQVYVVTMHFVIFKTC